MHLNRITPTPSIIYYGNLRYKQFESISDIETLSKINGKVTQRMKYWSIQKNTVEIKVKICQNWNYQIN